MHRALLVLLALSGCVVPGALGPGCTSTDETTPAPCPWQGIHASDGCRTCLVDWCDAQYTQAFGAQWATGDASGGACASYLSCAASCPCGDDHCQVACQTSECIAAFTAQQDCLRSHCAIACPSATGGNGGTGGGSGGYAGTGG
jgi:hypothetical protein